MSDLPIGSIVIGTRRREDYGDIAALAASLKRFGLLHPVVVDDLDNLVAGGRRLEAARQLGWDTIPARHIGELSEAERREIELEENLRRKDLTEYEQNKVMVGLATSAGEVLRQQESDLFVEPTNKSQSQLLVGSTNKSRGRPKDPTSTNAIAERIGIPEPTLRQAKRHVETVETFIPTTGPDWKQYHVLEARTHLEAIPEEDRPKAAKLIDQPATPPKEALTILRNLAGMPDQERRRVLDLSESPDMRDRSLAQTTAAEMPAMPDPRVIELGEIGRSLRKMIRLFPSDPYTAQLETLAGLVRDLITAIKEEPRGSNGHA